MTGPSDAVTGLIDAMKAQPLALALVVMNLALLALFYVIVQSAEHRHQINTDQLKDVMQLLANCKVTP